MFLGVVRTGSTFPNCELIWVVPDDPETPGQKAILITTRKAPPKSPTSFHRRSKRSDLDAVPERFDPHYFIGAGFQSLSSNSVVDVP